MREKEQSSEPIRPLGDLPVLRVPNAFDQFSGPGRVEILEEHDLGERCLMRIRQNVEAPASGVRSSYDWSLLSTAPAGKIIRIEFFIDREQALKAAGVLRADS